MYQRFYLKEPLTETKNNEPGDSEISKAKKECKKVLSRTKYFLKIEGNKLQRILKQQKKIKVLIPKII